MTQRLAKHVLQSVPIIFCAPKSSSPVMWSNYSGPTGSSPSHLSSRSCIRSARFFWPLPSLQLWRSVLTLARASARKNLLAFDSHVGPEDPDSPRLLSHSNPKQWNKYLIFQIKERNISVWPLSWPSVRTTTRRCARQPLQTESELPYCASASIASSPCCSPSAYIRSHSTFPIVSLVDGCPSSASPSGQV